MFYETDRVIFIVPTLLRKRKSKTTRKQSSSGRSGRRGRRSLVTSALRQAGGRPVAKLRTACSDTARRWARLLQGSTGKLRESSSSLTALLQQMVNCRLLPPRQPPRYSVTRRQRVVSLLSFVYS